MVKYTSETKTEKSKKQATYTIWNRHFSGSTSHDHFLPLSDITQHETLSRC